MAEISPPRARSVVPRIGGRLPLGEEGAQDVVLLVGGAQELLDRRERRGAGPQGEEPVELLALERQGPFQGAVVVQPRRAEHERPVVAIDRREPEALHGAIVVLAPVEQRLQQAEGGVVVQVVDQLHVSLERPGHPLVKPFERVARGVLAEQGVEIGDRPREAEQVGPVGRRPVSERPDLLDPASAELHERAAQELPVLDGRSVGVGGVDVRLHDPEMPLRDVPRRRGRGDEVGPRIPPVHQRLQEDVRAQVVVRVRHSVVSPSARPRGIGAKRIDGAPVRSGSGRVGSARDRG